MKGRSDRIAVIHAVYGLAWAGIAGSAGLPLPIAALLLGVSVVLVALSAIKMQRTPGAPTPGAALTGGVILRINIVTVLAVILAILLVNQLKWDNYLLQVVLVVMGLHFVPLWKLLGRPSLLVMGIVLIVAALIGALHVSAALAPSIAALTFLFNSARLSIHGRAVSA